MRRKRSLALKSLEGAVIEAANDRLLANFANFGGLAVVNTVFAEMAMTILPF